MVCVSVGAFGMQATLRAGLLNLDAELPPERVNIHAPPQGVRRWTGPAGSNQRLMGALSFPVQDGGAHRREVLPSACAAPAFLVGVRPERGAGRPSRRCESGDRDECVNRGSAESHAPPAARLTDAAPTALEAPPFFAVGLLKLSLMSIFTARSL